MKKPYSECRHPWDNMQILANGEVRPCCWCVRDLGNLNDATIEEIWNGDKAQNLRKDILEGNVNPMCYNRPCPYDTHHAASLQEAIDNHKKWGSQ